MSSRSFSYPQQSGHGAYATDRRARHGVSKLGAEGYTLIHGARQLRVGPFAFWLVLGTLAIMAVWTITTATYFAFRENVLTGLIARQAEMLGMRIVSQSYARRLSLLKPAIARSGAVRAKA